MRNKLRADKADSVDTFPAHWLIAGSAVLAILLPSEFKYTPSIILWTFSLWLESVAILPQLYMLQRTGEAENLTVHYIFALGLYRAFYVFNWVYRYWAEDWFSLVSFITGIIQTGLYSDFFWVYYKQVMKGKKFELPQ